MKVYLAGPIFGCGDEQCRDWRRAATDLLGADLVFDPMVRDYRGREHEPGIANEIVEQDKADIEAANAMIVYFDHPSVGTSMEVLHAWNIGITVVVVNVNGGKLSPWLRYHSVRVVSSVAEAVAAVLEIHA